MENEALTLLNRLNAQVLVLEAAVDAMFSVASQDPAMKQAVESIFEMNAGGAREKLADSSNMRSSPDAMEAFHEKYTRLIEALNPPPQPW